MTTRAISRRAVLQGAAATSLTLAVPGLARARTTADVVVIGAGLSGLNAALLLEQQDLDVIVLEGRNRVGGRVNSLDSVPGSPEAGANAIVGSYARLRDAARRFGAELVDHTTSSKLNRPKTLALGGEIIPTQKWPDSARNPFPAAQKETLPWQFVSRLISQENPLESPGDWFDPKFSSHDIPLYEFLKRQGASDAVIELAYNTNIIFGTSAHDVSLLQMLGNDFWMKLQRAIERVSLVGKGGNQRIPEAMARNLSREVSFGKKVSGIRSNADGAEVYCTDGSRFTARHVICSIPVPVLRNVQFDPVFTGVQERAIKTVAYAPWTQVHMVAKRPFWEDDGLPAAMWTDSKAGFVVSNRNDDAPEEITSLTAWGRGFLARYLDRLGPDGAKAAVIRAIEELRPAAKGQLEALYVKSWELDEFAGGADFMVWGPGQVTEFFGELWAPHGRVHFCGEHTAMLERGMEGAMESGERAAFELLEQI
jgi:monoamine oxidase